MATYAILPTGWFQQFFTQDGTSILAGGKLYVYLAGTTTLATTYQDSGAVTPNTNPIILDSSGSTPYEIWADQSLSYKFVLQDSLGNQIFTRDNLYAFSSAKQLIGPTGASSIGFIEGNASGPYSGAVLRNLQQKCQDIISALDFGMVGDGATDNSSALQTIFNFAKSRGTTNIFLPTGQYNFSSTLPVSNLFGLTFFGEGNPVGQPTPNKASALMFTGTGSGNAISLTNAFGCSFRNLWIGYTSNSYTGDLFAITGGAGGSDGISFIGNLFSGTTYSVNSAHSLLSLTNTLNTEIKFNQFQAAARGIIYNSFINVLTIHQNEFLQLTTAPIVEFSGLNQDISIKWNTFEPLQNGQAAGYYQQAGQATQNLEFTNNWCGDVTTNGGLGWFQGTAITGLVIENNVFESSGSGSGDYAVLIGACYGVSFRGNTYAGQAIAFTAGCFAVNISAEVFPGYNLYPNQISGIANVSGQVTWGKCSGLAGVFCQSKAYINANQSIPNSTFNSILYTGGNYYDQGGVIPSGNTGGGMHSASTNPSRFTVPAGCAGTFSITSTVTWAAGTGQYIVQVKKNSTGAIVGQIQGALNSAQLTQSTLTCVDGAAVAGDFYETMVWQNSGGALNVRYVADASDTCMSVTQVYQGG